jgi:ketosteroid isomerase-like protein
MKTFWAQNYPGIIHQSEENPRALTSYAEIADYWDKQVPAELDGILKVEDTDLRIDVIDDVATAYLYAMATAKLPGSEHPYKAPFRVSIVLKKIEGKWKFIHYHESRILNLNRVCEVLNAGEADRLTYGAATH